MSVSLVLAAAGVELPAELLVQDIWEEVEVQVVFNVVSSNLH